MSSKTQRFLVFLKPDAYMRKYVGAKTLEKIYNNKNFKILAFKVATLSENHAKKHYEEHIDKDFFPWLLKFITLGPVLAMIVEGDIQEFRTMIGKTKCQEAAPGSIRKEFGMWAGVNLVHASDGADTAKKELEIWETEIGLVPQKNVNQKIEEYISKWTIDIKDNTKELPKCCSELVNSPETENNIKEKIFKLLKEECYTTDEEKVKLFTEIIVESCKL
ncbi:MAG: nucleoside-diphosphate kinase [Candidatus Helarchaeota archaeon]